jgi:dinuclear metal center YbgI/SA1388 family protein
MVTRKQIIEYLSDYLNVEAFSDYCVNGLQVEGSETVTQIVTGVSASRRLFQAAVDMQAEMIIVHHGLFWKSTPSPFSLTGILKKRIKLLMEHNINFAAYHLPLDAHPVLGNNAQILQKMGFPVHEPFDVGFVSRPDSPLSTGSLKSRLDKCLPAPSTVYGNTQNTILAFAVVSGGGSGVLEHAAGQSLDALITGEISEPSIRAADELGISLYRAGHYNSERLGPIALADHLSNQFAIPVRFIDIPNPV